MKARDSKGTFSEQRLKVARQYVVPSSRKGILWAGIAVAFAVLGLALAGWLLGRQRFLAPGPVASGHALVEQDCAACHSPRRQVSAEACSSCHEKHGDELGLYTFAAHYLYRSNDFQRVVPSPQETPCAACHPEHQGRDGELTRVPDQRCLVCHEAGPFGGGHPQFAFARGDQGGAEPAGETDDAGLRFAHIHHVQEILKRRGWVDPEKACLACHEPRPDGRTFQPLDFDRHCDACHLTEGVATARLPLVTAGGDTSEGDAGVGVVPLETLRAQPGPAQAWAVQMNPAEFRQAGGRVLKTPLHHRDPWVLYNLRRLRRLLYQDSGLGELLTATADVPPRRLKALYREAVGNLRRDAQGLRSTPDGAVQAELAEIDRLLEGVESALENPYTPLDESAFLLALQPRDLPPEKRGEIEAVVEGLTAPCRQCHTVAAATFARVQADQRTLFRADFNHRAHILQRRCLDCHAAIPIEEHLQDTAGGAAVATDLDRAEIQNLPKIEACLDCHRPGLASNTCVTCHAFHPDASRSAHLLLYQD